MKTTGKRKRICVVLLTVNLLFIWGNSLIPGHLSGAFSQWISQVLARLLSLNVLEKDQGHGLLRKLAHFMEFCTLGIGFGWLFAMLKKRLWWAALAGILAACIDETIQMFVPGRGPAIRDVAIDSAGVLLGIGLLITGCLILSYRKRKDKENLL